jgi:uncharacterized protein
MTDTTGSECSQCTACCRTMKVEELDKPANVWCRHAIPGTGCGIYEIRPLACSEWSCVWLQSQSRFDGSRMGPGLRPDRCHVIVDTMKDKSGFILRVDKSYPDAWRKPRIQHMIKYFRERGLRVIVACGGRRKELL